MATWTGCAQAKPIKFDGTPYGFAGDVLIFAGTDEATMAADMGMGTNPVLEVYYEPGAP